MKPWMGRQISFFFAYDEFVLVVCFLRLFASILLMSRGRACVILSILFHFYFIYAGLEIPWIINPSILVLKGTVQRKLTGVLSGINRKLIISSIAAGYFLKKLKKLVVWCRTATYGTAVIPYRQSTGSLLYRM
jgi:hypothetical protein